MGNGRTKDISLSRISGAGWLTDKRFNIEVHSTFSIAIDMFGYFSDYYLEYSSNFEVFLATTTAKSTATNTTTTTTTTSVTSAIQKELL